MEWFSFWDLKLFVCTKFAYGIRIPTRGRALAANLLGLGFKPGAATITKKVGLWVVGVRFRALGLPFLGVVQVSIPATPKIGTFVFDPSFFRNRQLSKPFPRTCSCTIIITRSPQNSIGNY